MGERLWGLVMVGVAALAATFATVGLAAAAPPDDGGVGEIVVRAFTGSGAAREPIADVGVSVTGEDGPVGEGSTDAEGIVTIVVPAAGTYEVAVDPDTFPEGLGITGGTDREVDVLTGQSKVANFRLTEGAGVGAGGERRETGALVKLGNLSIAGLKLGAIIALASIGLSLIFGVTGLVNFAHGELVTLGAVIAWYFNAADSGPGLYIGLAAIPAVLIVAAFGWAQEATIWGPMRRRRAGNVSTLVVSIGLSLLLQYAILWAFDGSPHPYDDYAVQRPLSAFQPVNVEAKSLWIIAIAIIVLGAVGLIILKTRAGTAMRAVADNADLARASGIDVGRVITFTWVIGAALAALGGVMFGISENVQWSMGFRLLLAIFAAVVLGGLGTAFGAMVGGFVIGFAIEVSTIVIPTELKFAVALAALIGMLLVRPRGLLGQRERIG